MNDAISNNTNFKSANTEVHTLDGVSYVYLHGNKIAEVGNSFIRLFDGGYQSTTTKSRIMQYFLSMDYLVKEYSQRTILGS